MFSDICDGLDRGLIVVFLRHFVLMNIRERFREKSQGAEAFVACFIGITGQEPVVDDILKECLVVEISQGGFFLR